MSAAVFKNVYYTYNTSSQSKISADEDVFNFGDDYALKDISFTIEEGEFVAFLGHNGSGKSTVAKLLNGLYTPASGDVEIFGINTRDNEQLFDVRKSVGMVFQNPDNQMVATMVEDDVAFGPENIGVERQEIIQRVTDALEAVGMSEYRDSAAHRLSGGQKQRIAIAGVLAIKPKILVLDESTAMLDPVGRREIMQVIKKLNKESGITVILITHFMEEAAFADRVLLFNDGRVAGNGTPAEIFSDNDYLKSIGLSVPLAVDVAQRLKQKGLEFDRDILNIEELITALCQL